jgi:hypothetical protein
MISPTVAAIEMACLTLASYEFIDRLRHTTLSGDCSMYRSAIRYLTTSVDAFKLRLNLRLMMGEALAGHVRRDLLIEMDESRVERGVNVL